MYRPTDAESRLSYLLALEQVEIDAAITRYQGHLADLIEEIRRLLSRPRAQRTAEEEARIAHLRMIQAHAFNEDETLPIEVRTFYAALAVEKIAQDAVLAASGKGTVAQLERQMEEIRSREGLSGHENWPGEEAPHNYRHLAGCREELLKDIEHTLVAFLLRKYRMGELAEIYETDREAFDIQREVGRILMMESGSFPAEQELLEGYVGKTYGRDAVLRVLSRVRAIRSAA